MTFKEHIDNELSNVNESLLGTTLVMGLGAAIGYAVSKIFGDIKKWKNSYEKEQNKDTDTDKDNSDDFNRTSDSNNSNGTTDYKSIEERIIDKVLSSYDNPDDLQGLLAHQQLAINDIDDPKERRRAQQDFDTWTSMCYDENGDIRDANARDEYINDNFDKEQIDSLRNQVATGSEQLGAKEYMDKFNEAIDRKVSDEDFEKLVDEQKESAHRGAEETEKFNKKKEDLEKEIKDLEDKDDLTDEQKKELENKREELKKHNESFNIRLMLPTPKKDPKKEAEEELEQLEQDHKDGKIKDDEYDSKKEELEAKRDGETLSKEEVVDKATGKKKHVTIHTGPRGGRYYWPEGSPKDKDHKVYVESLSLYEAIKSSLVKK